MKLNRKLVLVSAAVLMGVSPVLGMTDNTATVQAATSSSIHNTYGKNSSVTVTKTQKFVDKNGKKTSKTATKGGKYTIWNVKNINGKVYYSIQTNLKYWIPATSTKGTVTYKSGSTTYTLKTNGKTVVTTTSKAKTSTKKTTSKKTTSTKKTTKKKTTSSKSSKTTSKKSSTKKSTAKKINVVKITMKRKAYVYDKNGKRVKNYMGTSYIGKGVTVKGLGTKTIKGVKYYALKPNYYYVKASDVTVK